MNGKNNEQVLHQVIDTMLMAQMKGVKICFGSDLLGPLAGYQMQEFFIRGKMLTAHQILLSAIVTPAEINGLGDKLEQVNVDLIADLLMMNSNPLNVDLIADLLMMNSNPLNDISILDEPEINLVFVMKEGRTFQNTARLSFKAI